MSAPPAAGAVGADRNLAGQDGSRPETLRPGPAPLPWRAPGTFRELTYRSAVGSLHYKLFLPGAPVSSPLPLLVMLHGCKQTPDDFATGTRMNEHAQRLGIAVAYPAQSRSHNIARCWNWFRPTDQMRGSGEPALIAGLTEEVMRGHDIDPSRVYVAGLSAGGAMALIMGDAYADLYAAVGVHSGVAPGVASGVQAALAVMREGGAASGLSARPAPPGHAPPSALPVIVFHGDADPTVHVQNGLEACARSVRALSQQGETLQPLVEPRSVPTEHPCTRTTWTRASGERVAELWVVHASGHGWFGGDPRGSFADPVGPDASAHLLTFLLSHRSVPGA